jgi:hypothetical protein
MKKLTTTTSIALLLLSLGSLAQQTEITPKAFYKRCLVTSVTGGPSKVLFTTRDNDGNLVKSGGEKGQIDPLIMEYGLTDKIGIGFSKGGESYLIDANNYYKADLGEKDKMMWASSKYLTADVSYHPYTTKRFDVSVFASLGYFKMCGDVYKQLDNGSYDWCGTPEFSYTGKGAIVRTGVRTRYYFSKRFGVMAMAYAFDGYAKQKHKPSPIADQPNNTGFSTMLAGGGMEFGICFRIFKQKGLKQDDKVKKSLKERWDEKFSNGWGQAKVEKKEKEESDKKPLFRLVWD